MKAVVILSLVLLQARCELGESEQSASPRAAPGGAWAAESQGRSAPERELQQIVVEEEEPKQQTKQAKSAPSKKTTKKPLDKHEVYLKKINAMIKDFGLDKKLDRKKIGGYFKRLEDKVYNSLRRTLLKQRKYMKSYEGVIRHYKDIAEKFNIQ